MLIFAHIVISLFGFGLATSMLFRPSSVKLGFSYVMICLAILSGAFLAVGQDLNIVQICSVGIVYTVIVTYLTVLGGRKLAALELEN